MKYCPRCAPWLALLLTALPVPAALPGDGGGRDVSVALFSTHSLRAVTVTPVGGNSWSARCARCPRKPLIAPLHIAGPADIFAGGTLHVSDDANAETRTATGLWHLRAAISGEVDVVLTMPSERYVAAVLNAEAAPDEPMQSLRTLAILARTYALNGSHYAAAPGHLAAELCDSTECQAMRLEIPSPAIADAVRATAGETLWFGAHRAEVFFSQNCGGVTEDAGSVWPALRGVPYLRSHVDPYCLRRDYAAWHTEIPLAQFAAIAQAEGWRLPADITAVRVTDRSASHRALRVAFTGATGATAVVSAGTLRFGIGRALGWNRVRSDAYDLNANKGTLVFDGHGYGHGVGLCQTGAAEMASEGKSAGEILGFYFPGTSVRILPGDDGWQPINAGPLTLRTTHPLSAGRIAALEQTWNEAQRRFPPRSGSARALTPEVVFAPTPDIFRQLTGQPGWNLASTQGATIVLQPDAILQKEPGNGSATLLHEMLHVLVEAESTARAPLWLHEGLVEVLAGEATSGPNSMPLSAIDDTLRNADSAAASERAHRAAAAHVRALIERYGISAVRGWLASGVPASVE